MEQISPKDIVESVLPHIVTVETLREPTVHHFLRHLFVPKDSSHGNGVFKKEIYDAIIVNWISASFNQPHVVTRVALLKQIDKYVPYLNSEELHSKIWPLIWTGLNEQDDELVIATLESFVPLLTFWKSQKSEFLLLRIQAIVPAISRFAESDTSLKVRVTAIRILPRVWQICPQEVRIIRKSNLPFFF